MGTRAGNSKHPLHHSLRHNDQRVGNVCQPGLRLLTFTHHTGAGFAESLQLDGTVPEETSAHPLDGRQLEHGAERLVDARQSWCLLLFRHLDPLQDCVQEKRDLVIGAVLLPSR
jgi:hypothetical protein